MTTEAILQLIQVVTLYCTIGNPGVNIESLVYKSMWGDRDRSANCFKKIWSCGHATDKSDIIGTLTHNCINKHIAGELK
jgi:hypothetical protein